MIEANLTIEQPGLQHYYVREERWFICIVRFILYGRLDFF